MGRRLSLKIDAKRLSAEDLRGRLQPSVQLRRAPDGAFSILGVDPGTRVCGFGVVRVQGRRFSHVAHGVVKTNPKEPFPRRLLCIYQGLCAAFDSHKPDMLSLENIFFGVNHKSSQKIGEGRAVAMLAAAQRDLPVYEFTPSQIKQAVSGHGRASKQQVQTMVKAILRLEQLPEPHDAADALAAAICCANSLGTF